MVTSEYFDWLKQQIANAQEKQFEYIIARTKNNIQYFYYDFDYLNNTLHQLLWTPAQRNAFPFESEEEVEQFKMQYVSPRKASIIRTVKPLHVMLDLIG